MAASCHEAGTMFGLRGSSSCGTAAEIIDFQPLADGRAMLKAQGKARFSLVHSWVAPHSFGLNYGQARREG